MIRNSVLHLPEIQRDCQEDANVEAGQKEGGTGQKETKSAIYGQKAYFVRQFFYAWVGFYTWVGNGPGVGASGKLVPKVS